MENANVVFGQVYMPLGVKPCQKEVLKLTDCPNSC